MLPPNVLRSDAPEVPEPPRSELDEARAALAAAQRTARMSSLISIASLLISGCAFVASISLARAGDSYAGETRLTGERPSAKARAPVATQFRIEELAVYKDNIVDGEVGTTELQDACVTGAKLASGSITADKMAAGSVSYSTLASDTVAQITSHVSNDRVVVGAVAEDGTILRGGNFNVTKEETGYYKITFQTRFAEPPVVVAVANTVGQCYSPNNPRKLTKHWAYVECKTNLLVSGQSLDMAFNFYASVAPA